MSPALVIAAITAAMELLSFISKASTTLKQSGELTKEQEAELDAKIAKLSESPWWKPETP